MKLIIGLGNPEGKYKDNRHNVGQMFIEANPKSQIPNPKIKFLKTDVFMNESGKFVKKWADFYKIKPEDLYIVHDDLDIKLGQYKIQLGKGPELHYGIQSIEEELGTKDFWRVRIGVDNRDPLNRIAGEEYVLQDFTKAELETLKGVFDAIDKDNSFPG